MKKPPKLMILTAVLGCVAAYAAWRIWGPEREQADVLTGYVEAETLYMATPIAGPVARVSVVQGQRVAAGQPLFAMDDAILSAQRQGQAAVARGAGLLAEDVRRGLRPQELGVTTALIAAARARERQARLQLDRVSTLAARGFMAKAAVDQARADHDAAAAELRSLESQVEAGRLGARQGQIAQADAGLAQAESALTESGRRISQLSPTAPAAGRVEEVFFQPGEWAAANQPVVSLIPDGRVRIRFFVPERTVASYAPGTVVRFSCDGCPSGLSASVRYVSPRPEFTPPVIYSRESRERLVFMVEAAPAAGVRLIPGQPIDVRPVEAAR